MQQPVWMNVILLAYVCLTVLIGALAIIMRVPGLRPSSPRAAALARPLIGMKGIFGWAAVGIFMFQFIFVMVLMRIEPRLEPEVFNLLAWIFLMILTSAFYMFALWLLSGSLSSGSGRTKTSDGKLQTVPTTPPVEWQGYDAAKVEAETRWVRRMLRLGVPVFLAISLVISLLMGRYAFQLTWVEVLILNALFYSITGVVILAGYGSFEKSLVRMRLEMIREGKDR